MVDEVLGGFSPAAAFTPERAQPGVLRHLGIINSADDNIGFYYFYQMQCYRAMDIHRHPMHELGKISEVVKSWACANKGQARPMGG